MELKKVLIKVINDEHDKFEWRHIAYVEEDLYKDFLDRMDCSRVEFADYVSKWVEIDFNITLSMAHTNDILVLKQLVKNFYRKAYPNLYLETTTDRQGWMRAWLTKKMKEELEYHGK